MGTICRNAKCIALIKHNCAVHRINSCLSTAAAEKVPVIFYVFFLFLFFKDGDATRGQHWQHIEFCTAEAFGANGG